MNSPPSLAQLWHRWHSSGRDLEAEIERSNEEVRGNQVDSASIYPVMHEGELKRIKLASPP